MSSILIKGMKMPKKCCDCDLLPAEIDWDEQWECPITEEIVHKYVEEREGKPSGCPLVEIPPHGRLIDADSIVEDIRECISDDEEILTYNITQQDRERTQLRIELLNDLIDELANAPTVIESEE